MPADLARDTAVTRLAHAPGWYTARLTDAWSFRTPSGGVLMTVALRAMQAELADASLRPVSASTLFCSPVPAGPLEVRVEVLRRSGAAAQVRAALSSTTEPGPGLEVSATFAREREGPDVLDASPPQVTRLEDAPPIRELYDWAFSEHLDMRLAHGQPWWEEDWPAGPARVGRWVRYHVPQRREDGSLDPLAIPPIADLMPTALHQRLGPRRQRYHVPSLDLTIHFLDPTRSEWLLTTTHAKRARAGVATAEVEVWDEAGVLVATATQMMMLRRWSRPGEPDQPGGSRGGGSAPRPSPSETAPGVARDTDPELPAGSDSAPT